MTYPLSELSLLQRATVAARTRTGDKTIATQVKNGLIQIVRVTFPDVKRGRATVTPVTEFMNAEQALCSLEQL